MWNQSFDNLRGVKLYWFCIRVLALCCLIIFIDSLKMATGHPSNSSTDETPKSSCAPESASASSERRRSSVTSHDDIFKLSKPVEVIKNYFICHHYFECTFFLSSSTFLKQWHSRHARQKSPTEVIFVPVFSSSTAIFFVFGPPLEISLHT